MKETCCFGAVFSNTTGEDNMLLLRDRLSRQRTFGNYLRIPPVRATYCCVTVFACTTGEGNVLLRDCFFVPPVKATCLLRSCFCLCHR